MLPEFLSLIKLPDEKGKRLHYLMVIPQRMGYDKATYAFPAGFSVVTAALKASGRTVFSLDLNFKLEPLDLLRIVIINNKIDVIMTGGFSVEFWAIKKIIDTAKEIKPGITTVVGGGIITADPAIAMEALENVDYGVIGEGEITVNALAHALENNYDPASLDGIICRRDGKWSIHEKFPDITDLDILPFPDYEGFEYGKILENSRYTNKWTQRAGSSEVVFLNIARSCPFLCTFCFHTCGNRHKQMSMNTIFKFIDWIRSLYPNIKAISIDGDLTFSNTQFAIEFCRRIKPYNLTWRANTRANVVTEEMFLALKDSGCTSIMLGIESADNKILKSMRKGITIEQVEKAFSIAAKVGIYARGTLIFGDPEETWETFLSTLDWYLANRKWSTVDNFWNITLGLIKAYPGTLLYKLACEKGIIKDRIQFLKDGCPPVNLSKMTEDEYNVIPDLFYILWA